MKDNIRIGRSSELRNLRQSDLSFEFIENAIILLPQLNATVAFEETG